MKHKIIMLSGALALGSCMSQSDIQASYVDKMNDCRSYATSAVPVGSAQSAALGAQFSECMNKSGWHVSVPKTGGAPPPTNVAQNPPTGAPSTNPSATIGARPVPPVQAQTVQQPPAAAYQPARPVGVAGAPYGQGAGRQF